MIETVLRKFDVVMNNAFLTFHKSCEEIPPFMDFENFEKARLYTMDIFHRGHLNEMYERIIKGCV